MQSFVEDKVTRPAKEKLHGDHLQFYIDGQWVAPSGSQTVDIINPATEESIGKIAMVDATDVDRAVAAAKNGVPLDNNALFGSYNPA